jgi:chemotaxis protein MotB
MRRALLLAGIALALGAGCTAPAPRDDHDFQVQRLEQERDVLAGQVRDEGARTAALQQRVASLQDELSTAQAQVAAQREHIDKLAAAQTELRTALDQRRGREVKRPAVPASPLPPAVDQTLQALAAKYDDRVWYERGRGAISFANDRLFDVGSDSVRSEAQPGLVELARVLQVAELAEYEFIVIGHTDATPISKPETLARHPSNWHLSVHRAIAVKDVLVKAGVAAARLGVMGYGDQRPVSADAARNRRVEIFIVRKGDVQPFEPVQPGR